MTNKTSILSSFSPLTKSRGGRIPDPCQLSAITVNVRHFMSDDHMVRPVTFACVLSLSPANVFVYHRSSLSNSVNTSLAAFRTALS